MISLYKIIVLTILFSFGLIGCNGTIDPKNPGKATYREIRNYLIVTTGKEGKEAFILDFNEGYSKEASLGRSFGGRFN